MVRAIWACAAPAVPPGRMKLVNIGNCAFIASTSASSRTTGTSVRRSRSPPSPGTDRSAPTSNKSFWIRASIASTSGVSRVARRSSPIAALASSTAPIASIRGASLRTRAPSQRAVSPVSPPRVTTLSIRTMGFPSIEMKHHAQLHIEWHWLAILDRGEEAPALDGIACRLVQQHLAGALQHIDTIGQSVREHVDHEEYCTLLGPSHRFRRIDRLLVV